MKTNMKKVLSGVLALLVFVALVAFAPVSRLVYSIYDTNRTNDILAQLEEEANKGGEEAPVVNDFRKQAFLSRSQETEGSKTVETIEMLVLTSESIYEIIYYERTVDGEKAYTSDYFRMRGNYTREGNLLTVEPGIGVLAKTTDGSSYTYYNAQYLNAEEAGGDKTRDEVYDMKYASREIALMKDGTFVVGGQSDSEEELGAPEGRNVYTTAVLQGRKTYKTLVTMDDGTYFVYSQSTNSNNAEQTTGALFGYGTYEIKATDKGVVPDESKPEETYDIISGTPGVGFTYANNNGSHMNFDLQNDTGFLMWLATSFNASSPTFYVTESGFTIKIGALKTVVDPWGLYVPTGDSEEPEQPEEPTQPEEPAAAEDIKLELETSVEGKPFVLELNADGTLRTGWTNYEQTMQEGSWAVVDGKLVLTVGYESTIVENAEGGLDITVNYGQMGEKVYTLTAAQFDALKSIELPAQSVKLELETSVEGKPFILELNPDGTLTTGWTNYEQTLQNGTWAVVDGKLVLTVGYESTIVENAEGGLDITVNYGQMGEKVYTLTAAQFDALKSIELPAQDIRLELETSVEGKPFILELKTDGTLTTGWTNYEQTLQNGTWAVVDGKLVLTVGYESTIVENAEGGLDITVNYGQMGEKVYTLTAAQFDALKSIELPAQDIRLELETSVEGKPFILELKNDGTLTTGWTNYEQTLQNGTWAVVDGKLVLTVGYESTIVENAEGGLDITVNYGQMGEKIYTLTAAQFAELKKSEKPVAEVVRLELETSVAGKPFVLVLKDNGTLQTGWTNYEQTMKAGKWCILDGSLVLNVEYASTIAENAEGGLDITVNYGQMGEKIYTLTADQYAALQKVEVPMAEIVRLELETSVEGKPFVLVLNDNGTLQTGWTNYAQTMKVGTWTVTDGALVLTMDYESTIVENAEGGLDITVNYGQMGEKVYTMSADQAKAILN